MKNLNKILSSWTRIFLTGVFTLYINLGVDMFSKDLPMVKKLLSAGILALIHVYINARNPKYKRYGVGSTPEPFKPEKNYK